MLGSAKRIKPGLISREITVSKQLVSSFFIQD